jgi:hypothetical protein
MITNGAVAQKVIVGKDEDGTLWIQAHAPHCATMRP